MLTLAIGGVVAQHFNPKMVFGLSVALSVVPAVFEQGMASLHPGALFTLRMLQACQRQAFALRTTADPVMRQSVTETGSSRYFQH